MKKIIIVIFATLFTVTLHAQKKNKHTIDSISIYHPYKNIKLKTFFKINKLDNELNKLNDSLKTNEFIIHYYRNDGVIMRCRVKPVIEKKPIMI